VAEFFAASCFPYIPLAQLHATIRVPNSPPAQPKTSWTGGLFNSALRTGGLRAG
jgi:hypothetical protein